MAKTNKAKADGFYTVGTVHFKLRKGKPIPAKAEEVFYNEGNEEATVTASDRLAKRIIAQHEDNVDDAKRIVAQHEDTAADDGEIVADEEGEVAAEKTAKGKK